MSGKNERQWVTLPDVVWAELNDEAENAGVKVSDIIKAYIQQGRETVVSQLADIRTGLATLSAQVGTLASIIEEMKTGARPAVEPHPTQTSMDTLMAMYHPNGSPPDPFAPTAPELKAPTKRWWRGS